MEHKFEIGDRVRIKDYKDLPVDFRNNRNAVVCGKEGEIADILWSQAKQVTVYRVLLDGAEQISKCDFSEAALTLLPPLPEVTYGYETERLENVVVARFYEYCGDDQRELARGHGHIIHDGMIGIAQAASYAIRRCYEKLAGNDNSKSYYINK